MNLSPDWAHIERGIALLAAEGIAVTREAEERLWSHMRLVQKWNKAGGFVSIGDINRLEQHVADSLSLVPYLVRHGDGPWLDIGPGGGFPSIPAAILLSQMRVVVVERSEKKAGLLSSMIPKLGLDLMKVVGGEFPAVHLEETPVVITARAVERPKKVFEGIARLVETGATYLCQTEPDWWRDKKFHVEHVVDQWTQQGLRRSALYRVTQDGG